MVLRAGIEPARPEGHRIFLPATVFTACKNAVCGLDFTFTFYYFHSSQAGTVKSLHFFGLMKLRKYTETDLRSAVENSFSFAQTLKNLNIVPCGGNYRVLKRAIAHFNVDISHFTFQLWNKGKKIGAKVAIEDYLNNKRSISSNKLKKRLINEKLLHPKCSSCQLESWLRKPIPLELDHINGDSSDNRLENLRLLCPNCHALTPTYRGKNKKSKLSSVLPF